jgi:hypothetical protein
MQVRKLAVICNICFWLTLLFQFWKNARALNIQLLNTIVILGVVAVLLNIVWLAGLKKNRIAFRFIGAAVLNGFNLLSFGCQLVFIWMRYG